MFERTTELVSYLAVTIFWGWGVQEVCALDFEACKDDVTGE